MTQEIETQGEGERLLVGKESEMMPLQNEVVMTGACWQCCRAVTISFGFGSAEPEIRITAPAPASTQIFFGDLWIPFLLQIVL
jgi:hypothetical protein